MPGDALSRELSRPVLLLYGLGTILGAGIYVLIGKVAAVAGPLALWSFLLAAALAGVTAVSYAALAPAFPEAAGEAAYVREAFGRRWLTTTVGLLLAFTGIVSAGVLARGFDAYLGEFFSLPSWLVVAALLLLLGALAAAGVSLAAGVAVGITLLEILGLLLVLVIGRQAWLDLPAHVVSLVVPPNASAWLGIGSGTVLALYAFIGFEDMVNMAEEARDPQRDLPFAIFASLAIAALLYLLVGTTALLTLSAEGLASSPRPLGDVVRAHRGPVWLISGVSLIAVINGALVQLIMASRVLFGLARQAALPSWLGVVNVRTRAPTRATMVVTLFTLVLTLLLPIERLAELTSLVLLAVFAFIHASLLRLGEVRRRAGVALFWPVLGLVSCCG
ncbi:MAG: amino acid permease, partial [Planctomycetales bacterium]|nr:amino acid permease [Planctomycetales bacterium]